jgi:4-hydroxybenzoate polyprenyltransferase
MPEPTALVTAGLLLAWRPRAPGVLLAIPPAWLLVAAATLWTMAGQ